MKLSKRPRGRSERERAREGTKGRERERVCVRERFRVVHRTTGHSNFWTQHKWTCFNWKCFDWTHYIQAQSPLDKVTTGHNSVRELYSHRKINTQGENVKYFNNIHINILFLCICTTRYVFFCACARLDTCSLAYMCAKARAFNRTYAEKAYIYVYIINLTFSLRVLIFRREIQLSD